MISKRTTFHTSFIQKNPLLKREFCFFKDATQNKIKKILYHCYYGHWHKIFRTNILLQSVFIFPHFIIFFYTEPIFTFYVQEDFYVICNHTVAVFLFLQEDLVTFHGSFFVAFLCFFNNIYNHFHNILRLFDVFPNFPFTTSESMRDYFL